MSLTGPNRIIFPFLSYQCFGSSCLIYLSFRSKIWSQLRSLTQNSACCHLPSASSGKSSGHTWGARASPRAEVITQKRTKLPESRFWGAMSRFIFCGPACLWAQSPQETQQERVGCWLMCLIDTTPGQRAKEEETVILQSFCSLGGVSLGPSLRRAGMWQSQDSHLKSWNMILLLHHQAGVLGSGFHGCHGAGCLLLTSVSQERPTFETLGIFRDVDQREFVNIDWDWLNIYICSAL